MSPPKKFPLKPSAAWFCALLLIALLAVLGNALRGMRHARGHAGAAHAEGVPPALNAVMMGLGGFRGILSEALWFRMERLQFQGRFLEITQLADWITRLDPHATEAWVYNAWNLAYNVSAMMRRPEDRLRWVENGVKLLRDEALVWSPGEPRLHRELAWMYRNKIGSSLDRAHFLYKLSLAAQMAPLLNPDGTLADDPPPGVVAGLRGMRLDPAAMRALQTRFGPLDWRVPESHSLYWSMGGLAFPDDSNTLACYREAYLSLFTMFLEHGRFTGDLEAGVWSTERNPALADGLGEFLRETLAVFPRGGVVNIYARFLAHRVRDAAPMDTRIAGWHAELNALAPDGMVALPVEMLQDAPVLPTELFNPVP